MIVLTRLWPSCSRPIFAGCLAALLLLAAPATGRAETWDEVIFVRHSTYQAVNSTGTSAYSGGFPVRLRGVVLNNTEDWLDPTAAYDDEYNDPEDLMKLGGQAEFFIQAVDLPEDTWDNGDFGGTSCWMGQNYGNHPMHKDAQFSYDDDQWYDELDRLHIWHPDQDPLVSPLVRAGMLVEIHARQGLHYAGKMNVNEKHDNDPGNDFEVVILRENYDLPEPTAISLSAIKDSGDVAIFDEDRETGGERYQSTLIEILNVRLQDTSGWGRDSELALIDDTGRTLDIYLGLNPSFDAVAAPEGYFDVVGILNQSSGTGKDGYYLLVMNAADFTILPIPEPAGAVLLAAGMAMLLVGARWRRRRR
jgi:hypothetical protein